MEKITLPAIVIYGAQMVAVSVYYAIKTLYRDVKVLCFVVKDQFSNPTYIDGIPVVTLDYFQSKNESGIFREEIKVYIATPENHHADIMADLRKRGINNYICIDSKKEAMLMEQYFSQISDFPLLRSCPKGRQKADISVYMSQFYRDHPLKSNCKIPDWIQPIQAGASLTDVRIADIRDNQGENISERNVNYSELSAMYWVGKHRA